MDQLRERNELVCGRLTAILEDPETEDPDLSRYLTACSAAALSGLMPGKSPCIGLWLSERQCGRVWGRQAGRYLGILAAEIALALELPAGWSGYEQPDELTVAVRELFVEIFGMLKEEVNPAALRDTLYYFFLDYAEEMIEWQRACILREEILCGGPMLFLPARLLDECPSWEGHASDSSIYLGGQFAQRCREAFRKSIEKSPLTERESAAYGLLRNWETREASGSAGESNRRRRLLAEIFTRENTG